MATKREAVAQLSTRDIRMLADAAEHGTKNAIYSPKDVKAIKRAVKILRTVRAAS